MTLTEKVAELKKSEMYILQMNGQILGFRLKLFNLDSDVFDYYDFDIESVTQKEHKEFINSIVKELDRMELHKDVTSGLLVTDFEVKNKILIQCFDNEQVLNTALGTIKRVYRQRG